MVSREDGAIGFQEADRRYAELRRQRNAGTISDEEFDAQLRQLMVQDDENRWWAKSRNTGAWHYHDGSTWVQDTPPVYQRPQTLPEESMPNQQPEPEQDEWSLASQTSIPYNAPGYDESERKPRRGVPGWAIMAFGLVLVAVLAGVGIVAATGGQGILTNEAQSPAPGYTLFEHDSGALSVEVPSEWDERVVVDSEGEKGRSSWSSFLGEGESVGPSLTAVNDLYSWRNGTRGHQGVYMVASEKLAQGYTDDELVASGPNDYSSSCEAGTVQDLDRPPYSGKILNWENCGGESDHVAFTLAIAPEGRECVVVAQVGGYFDEGQESVQHVLDTVKANCDKIS